jgi:hypothetical protein
MVAREASLLPHTAQQAGVDAANVTTKSVSLGGKCVWPASNRCKIRGSARRLSVPIRELFHRLLSNSLFLRLDLHV